MAEQKPLGSKPSDDQDLLANAIPIEDLEAEEIEPVAEVVEATPSIDLAESTDTSAKEIRTFDKHKGHTDTWNRKPNVDGHGATHTRTFVSKLRLDAIEHLDNQINMWLDQHPEYEVKHVTASVGILTGKLREEALFLTVWV